MDVAFTAQFDDFFDLLIAAIELRPPSAALMAEFPRNDIARQERHAEGIYSIWPSAALIAWAKKHRKERDAA